MNRAAILCACAVMAACANERNDAPAVPSAKLISPDGARHESPSYSPDGSHVAYWMPANGDVIGWQLWVANADLTSPVRLPATSTIFGAQKVLWSPDGKTIATVSSDFGAADIVMFPSAGGQAKRVTTGAGAEVPIAWHPDGDRLFYFATNNATVSSFVVSVRTGATSPTIAGEKLPYAAVPSPDGAHIAYMELDGSKTTIWAADSAGKNPRQLTTEGFEQFAYPFLVWSPDSREIVYESRRTGTADVWVAPVDGGPRRQLTHDVRNDFAPAWSPDGKWVAFISDRGKQTDVWAVPSAGGAEVRVTDTPDEEQQPLIWRPHSNELTYVTRSQKSALWEMDLADGKERRLTPDTVRTGFFDLSPNGKDVLYVINHGGVQDLAVTPITGGASRVLIAGGGTVANPTWSPDGSKIAFASDRGGTVDIWVIDSAGGAPRQLVNWPGIDQAPVWSKDGSEIYFQSDRDARLGDAWRVPVAGGEPKRVTTNGSVGTPFFGRRGVADVLVSTLNPKGGQFGISVLSPDGTLRTVWDKTNAFAYGFSPTGDSVLASVEQPDGKNLSMILSTKTGAGRVVLTAKDAVGVWSNDGKSALVFSGTGGASDLAILTLADNKLRQLPHTPDDEADGIFTPDDKALVLRRQQLVDRIASVDLSKVIGGNK